MRMCLIPYFFASQSTALIHGAPLSVEISKIAPHRQRISSNKKLPRFMASSFTTILHSGHDDSEQRAWGTALNPLWRGMKNVSAYTLWKRGSGSATVAPMQPDYLLVYKRTTRP